MDIIMLMAFSEHFLVSVKLSCSIYAEASLGYWQKSHADADRWKGRVVASHLCVNTHWEIYLFEKYAEIVFYILKM